MALLSGQRYLDAVEAFTRAIKLDDTLAQAHYNRATALRELGRLDEAVASYGRTLALRPDLFEAWTHRALVRYDLGLLDAALADQLQALAVRPDDAGALVNLGNTLCGLGRIPDALASFDRAIALDPDLAEAWLSKAGACLVSGEFAQGFALYEWRWKAVATGPAPRAFAQPLWLGVPDLAGQRILLHCEQGLGDSIQFVRYATRVAARGAQVILECPSALMPLFAAVAGVHTLIEAGQPLPPFDLHCPLLSLPHALAITPVTEPTLTRYLAAPPAAVQGWSEQLGKSSAARIGLVWSGSTWHKHDRHRSLPLASLLPFLPSGPDYICLQQEVRESDVTALQSRPDIRFVGDQLNNFADTAALCDHVDLVVGVDTSVMHLSAALGRPTWLLLPAVPDWRWGLHGERSPWYPSLRLIRQPSTCNWEPALALMRDQLATFVRSRE
jgi:hypothetical protein